MPLGSATAPVLKTKGLGALALRLLLCTISALLFAAPRTVHASRDDQKEALTAITPPSSHQPEPPANDDSPASRIRQPWGPQVSAHVPHTMATDSSRDRDHAINGRHQHPNASASERRTAAPLATASTDRDEVMHAVEPFVMHGAEVSDPVGGDLPAALQFDPWAAHPHAAGAARMRMHAGWGATGDSGAEASASSVRTYADGTGAARESASHGNGRRSLLHGNRPPSKYSKCNSCTLVSCNATKTNCSGHCKKNGKLFFCSKKNIAAPNCVPRPAGTPPPTDSDPLQPFDTVIIKAPTPYIGCADIANRRTGCPTPFTRGLTADGKRLTVRGSRCVTARYDPDCGSPFFPFGVCECRLLVSGVGFVKRPCVTGELTLRDPPEDVGIAVDVRGRVTYTGFSDYTDGDEVPRFAYNVTVEAGGEAVPVMMEIFETDVLLADEEDVVEESEISDDYDFAEILPADAPIGGPKGFGFKRSGGAKMFVNRP